MGIAAVGFAGMQSPAEELTYKMIKLPGGLHFLCSGIAVMQTVLWAHH